MPNEILRNRLCTFCALSLWYLAFAHISLASAQESFELAALEPGEVKFFISSGKPESTIHSEDIELVEMALEAWSQSLNGLVRFTPSDEFSALLRVYWESANYGQYGEMQPIFLDGRRGAAVYINVNTDALGPEIEARATADPLFRDVVVYLTCLHELGHALGLEHTDNFEDIMYSFEFGGDIVEFFSRYRDKLNSREDIGRQSGISDGDLNQLRTLYRDFN